MNREEDIACTWCHFDSAEVILYYVMPTTDAVRTIFCCAECAVSEPGILDGYLHIDAKSAKAAYVARILSGEP